MRYSLVLSVLALVSAVGAPAAAQPREEEAPTSRWYGWQILAAVGVCDTVAAVSTHIAFNGIGADRGFDTRLEASGVWLVAAGVRALSAPTVHFAHGNVGRGFGSLLLNLTVPAATGALGALSGFYLEGAPLSGAFVGWAAGALTVTIIDVAALAYDRAPRPRGKPRASLGPTLALVPVVAPGWTGLGASGSF